MTRQLTQRVDDLEAEVAAIREHGTTATQRKDIAEALDPDTGEGDDQEGTDDE